MIPKIAVSSNSLIVAVSLFLLLFTNFRFIVNVTEYYPLNLANIAFILSVAALLFAVNVILFSLVCIRFTTKPILMLILLLAASTAYFMDTYNVIIDDVMIENIVRTDTAEVTNLISINQILYILLLGIIPAFIVWKIEIKPATWARSIFTRLRLMGISVVIIAAMLLPFGDSYASFFREHKLLRFYTNPTYPIYSLVSYVEQKTSSPSSGLITQIGLDAKQEHEGVQRKLIVVVVGETIRADHMSLNGYERETNPLLNQSDVISFTNVWSCGTSTAVSLPCMFSSLTRNEYSSDEALSTENVLDVVARTGVNVIWLDNNSDSKGVALRVPYENLKTADTNTSCDSECRDVGMLEYMNSFIKDHTTGDILVVMHQMGNHGPAYYKRYPDNFEKYTPTCQTNILENCSAEEIINSYDNAILYTDYFLNQTIKALKAQSSNFSTAMIFIGDHGESLGEYGLYLHGLPYAMAPDSQKHVPLVMWFDNKFKASHPEIADLYANSGTEYSHDNIFHTILGLTDISTDAYESALDITAP